MPMLIFSVILPTYRRPDTLPAVLEHLAGQTIGGKNIELIIIDDAGQTKTKAITDRYSGRFAVLHYIKQAGEGQSRARSQGMALAAAPLLFFTGDDILLEPDVLEKHASFHAQHANEKIAVLGRVDIDPRLLRDPFIHWLNYGGPQNVFSQLKGSGAVTFDKAESAHLSISRDLGRRAAFREDIRYYENYLWAQELSKTGCAFYYLEDAGAYHYHPISIRKYGARMFQVGKTMAQLAHQGHSYFLSEAKLLRPAKKLRLLRYGILGCLFGREKYRLKYWIQYLGNKQYQGYISFQSVSSDRTSV
jgi:glycosyltransferase involved in cell wall biosynthesis